MKKKLDLYSFFAVYQIYIEDEEYYEYINKHINHETDNTRGE